MNDNTAPVEVDENHVYRHALACPVLSNSPPVGKLRYLNLKSSPWWPCPRYPLTEFSRAIRDFDDLSQCLDRPWSKEDSHTITETIFCVLNDVLAAEHPHEMQLPVSKDLLRGTSRGNAFGVETTGLDTRPAWMEAENQFHDRDHHHSFEYTAG
ncbi:hypothetical protein N7513_002328 [Penicillium frequentans]|nr:hypothetical protein N7513_002328 [Penicillium glabrum]